MFPADSLVYNWNQFAGSNPQLGTFLTSTNESAVLWQAPPCKGTITIKVHVDDLPDEMYLPCPGGGTRDDDPKDFQQTIDVKLPAGCEEASGHDSSVHWNHTENLNVNPLGPWGLFSYGSATKVVDFKYESCQWKCEISNVQVNTDLKVRAANYPGYVSITSASDVPCVDANLAKYNLNDPDLTDDIGAPLGSYWIYNAIVAHEQKHKTDWVNYYGSTLYTAITVAETVTVNINCDVPYTITCESARSYWINEIDDLFDWAWTSAGEDMDDPGTGVVECEVDAYVVENAIEQPVSDALPAGCTP
jgi:hypothetical protein